jgi:hypothetical protein
MPSLNAADALRKKRVEIGLRTTSIAYKVLSRPTLLTSDIASVVSCIFSWKGDLLVHLYPSSVNKCARQQRAWAISRDITNEICAFLLTPLLSNHPLLQFSPMNGISYWDHFSELLIVIVG